MNAPTIGHAPQPQPVSTIAEFCAAHRISRTHLHNLHRSGKGPRIMKIGKRVLISLEAAADWRQALEREQAQA